MSRATEDPKRQPPEPTPEPPKRRRSPLEHAIDGYEKQLASLVARETAAVEKVKVKYAGKRAMLTTQIDALKKLAGGT
ncbi:MAG TPA: hypothetical protein VFR23_24450 [Jiangellaceae bacterium]|nr:hypothetical protein [Jiangellaceae bacterium]